MIINPYVFAGPTYDPDAQAYFTANTAITSDADKNAINTFYLGLKSDGIYTKIKAMYLPIWGSASSSKWNLVNPLDTNAAFRLTFATGMTFTSSGMTSNGTSGYADTFYNQIAQSMNLNSNHLSYYSRTSNTGSNWEIGCTNLSPDQHFNFALNYLGTAYYSHNQAGFNTLTPLATTGLYMSSRTASNLTKFYRNGTSISSVNFTPLTGINRNVWICGRNSNLTKLYSNRQCSFASIGDGLTDTDASNFSNRVNTLLAYFGINTYPVVSDADAQAYINANDAITSQSDANAINTFFTGLKSDGIYTKIKAMYLPIWGSASSSKWNLVNPLDTNSAFRLTFSTGFTFTSNGMLPNGTSAFANTFLSPSSVLNTNNSHLSFYSQTNVENGGYDAGTSILTSEAQYILMILRFTGNLSYLSMNVRQSNIATASVTNNNSTGFFIANRSTSNLVNGFRNGSKLLTDKTITAGTLPSANIILCAFSNYGTPSNYSTRRNCFASIGDGLTDTEATNFSNRVNTLMNYFGINTY